MTLSCLSVHLFSDHLWKIEWTSSDQRKLFSYISDFYSERSVAEVHKVSMTLCNRQGNIRCLDIMDAC